MTGNNSELKQVLAYLFFPVFCAFMLYGCLHRSNVPRRGDGTIDYQQVKKNQERERNQKQWDKRAEAIEKLKDYESHATEPKTETYPSKPFEPVKLPVDF